MAAHRSARSAVRCQSCICCESCLVQLPEMPVVMVTSMAFLVYQISLILTIRVENKPGAVCACNSHIKLSLFK